MEPTSYANIEEATPLVAKKAPTEEVSHKTSVMYKVLLVVAVVAVSALGYSAGSFARTGSQLETTDLRVANSRFAPPMNLLDDEDEGAYGVDQEGEADEYDEDDEDDEDNEDEDEDDEDEDDEDEDDEDDEDEDAYGVDQEDEDDEDDDEDAYGKRKSRRQKAKEKAAKKAKKAKEKAAKKAKKDKAKAAKKAERDAKKAAKKAKKDEAKAARKAWRDAKKAAAKAKKDEAKAARKAEREAAKAERDYKKSQKEAEKVAAKAQKEAEAAEKKALRESEKAGKKAESDAKKAEKLSEKAAKKAEREAEKLAKQEAASATATATATSADPPDFCWKDSYPRGVGTIPKICADNQDRIGFLCYEKCPSGYKRFGFDCHQICPTGWTKQGLFCRKSEYGRGAGFPWKFKDGFRKKKNDRKLRCEAAHGVGKCEQNGLIYYPKCKPGYKNVGCCICRPHVPDCKALGMNKGIDLSCAKKIKIGKPKVGLCKPDQEINAGLCYKNCKSGYKGVGPVCWAATPDGMVGCGMGAAKNKFTCGTVIGDQVVGPLTMVWTVATLGT